jgi:hypothetical protein
MQRHSLALRSIALTDNPTPARGAQSDFKLPLGTFLKGARPLPLLTAPLVYSVGIPLLILDVWMTLYQVVCFPVYGIPRVDRRQYLVVDRHRLAYLNAIEKVHCAYCSYANGILAYLTEIAARTEEYWCPIRHDRQAPASHSRYPRFVAYGDAEGYRRELPRLRAALSGERVGVRPAEETTKASRRRSRVRQR